MSVLKEHKKPKKKNRKKTLNQIHRNRTPHELRTSTYTSIRTKQIVLLYVADASAWGMGNFSVCVDPPVGISPGCHACEQLTYAYVSKTCFQGLQLLHLRQVEIAS